MLTRYLIDYHLDTNWQGGKSILTRIMHLFHRLNVHGTSHLGVLVSRSSLRSMRKTWCVMSAARREGYSILTHVLMLHHQLWLPITQVSRIKEKVEERSGVPPVQQRLIHSGKQMCVHPSMSYVSGLSQTFIEQLLNFSLLRQDDKSAIDMGVKPGDTLHLVLALRGGSS